MKTGEYATVVWDPTIPEVARLDGDRIVVNRTDDEELIWRVLHQDPVIAGADDLHLLRQNLGIALDKLQDQALAQVRIPQPGEEIGMGITDAILAVLREQRNEYARALQPGTTGDTAVAPTPNDVLRIAYNFASDATTFLRLIVSICDLKPIVLWGTIAEHFELAEAFNSLPWSRSTHKPSLKSYQQAIGDARNSAFHNLFPFRKSLRISLPEMALGAPELQIFSEHTKKSQNQLTYRDRELVDVLIEFTRARERSLSLSFWAKNLKVMDATVNLFQRTNDFVKALSRVRQS
jgi:hypothetical protein